MRIVACITQSAVISQRRVREPVLSLAGQYETLYIDTAEHSVLAKLEWFRCGGDVSERQGRDAVGIRRVQRDRLDVRRACATGRRGAAYRTYWSAR